MKMSGSILNSQISVLKCQISAVKILLLDRRPTPSSTAWTHSLFDSFRLVFRLVFRLSVNEDVRINFKQSNQSFNAFNAKIVKNYYGAPPPPELERAADDLSKLVFRSIVVVLVFKSSIKEGQVSPSLYRVWYSSFIGKFKGKSHRNLIAKLLLLCGDVESNPGPVMSPYLKITTINCRGLTDKVKFLSTISKLKRDCANAEHVIYCLQEVHHVDLDLLKLIWEGSAISLSSCSRASKGTLILGKRNFSITNEVCDLNGRFNILKLAFTSDLEQQSVTIANVYAPNNHKESLVFFEKFFEQFETFLDITNDNSTQNVILCGDFNCVFDPSSDSIGRNSSNAEKELVNYISNKLSHLELWDMVQVSQHRNNFTWGKG